MKGHIMVFGKSTDTGPDRPLHHAIDGMQDLLLRMDSRNGNGNGNGNDVADAKKNELNKRGQARIDRLAQAKSEKGKKKEICVMKQVG